jgi:phosphotransferase system  glucose/maltose/N-acetylglucosamine-specific IIC component
MRILKDILLTLAVGAAFGGGFLALSSYLKLPIPAPHQRPVFFIGIVLFSGAFRLLMVLREES